LTGGAFSDIIPALPGIQNSNCLLREKLTMPQPSALTTKPVSAGLSVKQNRLGCGVYTGKPVKKGTTLAVVTGRRARQRTRMTVQVDWTTHVELGMPWEFINHSCEPNCHLVTHGGSDTIEIVTLRDLEPDEELFLDYDLFEYEIGHFPAACLCGSAACRGSVRGYRFLPRELQEARAAFVADYLKKPAGAAPETQHA
jgi:hypothetical protein